MDSLNRPIASTKTDIKSLSKNKSSRPYGFLSEFYQAFEEDITYIPFKLFKKKKKNLERPEQ